MEGQLSWHRPPAQIWPELQRRPQVPQLARSVLRLTQEPEQLRSPCTQETMQRPLEQILPEAHLVPHLPQLARSVLRSTQEPAHLVSPETQEI